MDPAVHLSADTSLGEAEKLRGALEDQLTSALANAVDKVDGDYHNESEHNVMEELMASTKDSLHPDIAEALTLDETQLRSVAAEIVKNNTQSG